MKQLDDEPTAAEMQEHLDTLQRRAVSGWARMVLRHDEMARFRIDFEKYYRTAPRAKRSRAEVGHTRWTYDQR